MHYVQCDLVSQNSKLSNPDTSSSSDRQNMLSASRWIHTGKIREQIPFDVTLP